MTLESKAILQTWQAKYQFSFHHKAVGKLQVFENQQPLEDAKPLIELKNDAGANQRIVSATELLELEPALKIRH